MAVDPQHRYSNESEMANEDIYDDFKLKKPFSSHGFCEIISAFQGLTDKYIHINPLPLAAQKYFDKH